MNVENYIKQESLKLKNSRRSIELVPDIAESHIISIKRKYKNELAEDIEKYILVISYTSTGWFFLTGDCFYYDNFMQGGMKAIRFADISDAYSVIGNNRFSIDKLIIKEKGGKEHELDGSIDGIDVKVLESVIKNIAREANNSNDEFIVSEQGIMSYQLPGDIKLLYLKILCNYAYINDQIIDSEEYNTITKFSVRMELQKEERVLLREYMNNISNRIKTGYLVKEIEEKTLNQSGQWDAVRYSLIQDALCIHDIQFPDKNWRYDGFIGSLIEAFNLNSDQVDTMAVAVKLNTEMIKKDSDMEKLKKRYEDLINEINGTSKYVPSSYLFCSGSVYSIKLYFGFLKCDETNQKTKNKQREMILQEIILNNQKSVNILIGDINYLADRLERALIEEDKMQSDYDHIKMLLSRIRSAGRSVEQSETCKKRLDEMNNDEEEKNG